MPTPVPKLPGYTATIPPCFEKERLGKKQTLSYCKGYPHDDPIRIASESAPEPSPQAMLTQTYGSPKSTQSLNSTLPKWVENDRKVLRFYGYYKEAVTESNIENHRVRRVVLFYYLEDDSCHLQEPRQDNSGLPQGILFKRHKIPKSGVAGGGAPWIGPADLSVGDTVSIYGRTIILVDADSHTRQWYADRLGKEQGPAQGYPDDPVDAYREHFGLSGRPVKKSNDLATFVEAQCGKPSHLLEGDRLKQFLSNNGKVLRFWCVWDDRQGMYGDRRPFVLHFYLEDDTAEINEMHGRNTGRDPFPQFIKRGPLPKVSRGSTTGRVPKSLCYKPEDFRLGSYIHVLGRDFLLHDCDDFTRGWYKANLGYADEMLEPLDVQETVEPLPRPAMPPYNGYGTLDDSKQNCVALVPKPPKKDMHKLMNKDKIILRFTARMAETATHKLSTADAGRSFVLSYFMMDDSILIFEPPIRNSGITGGKFLERQRVYKPESEEIYTYQDLYVGGQLEVFSRAFELVHADEYTFTYMENNKHIFVMADVDAMLKSIRAQTAGHEDALLSALISVDSDGSGTLDQSRLEAALAAAGLHFTRHQAIALQRRLDRAHTGVISTEDFLAALGPGFARS